MAASLNYGGAAIRLLGETMVDRDRGPVGVIGLGRSGLALALMLAEAGYQVSGWDSSYKVRNGIESGDTNADEPHLSSMLSNHAITLTRPETFASRTPLVFICVPSQTANGAYTTRKITESIGALTSGRRNRLIAVVTSTVGLGTCRSVLLPTASKHGIRMAYWPITSCEGHMIDQIRWGTLGHIIGHNGDGTLGTVTSTLSTISMQRPHSMSYESAELAKLTRSVSDALHVGLANLIGRISEECDASVTDVIGAVDPSLDASVGYGGRYLPHDIESFGQLDGGALSRIVVRLNNDHVNWVARKIIRAKAKTVTLLGRMRDEPPESFVAKLEQTLTSRGVQLAPIESAEAVVIVRPLSSINLAEYLADGALVLDLHRSHPYLTVCNVRYTGFGTP
jgi:UDP-glucose 6-dehydrogenase